MSPGKAPDPPSRLECDLPDDQSVRTLEFSGDGSLIWVLTRDGRPARWDLQTNELAPLGPFLSPVAALLPSGPQTILVSDDGEVVRLDEAGRIAWTEQAFENPVLIGGRGTRVAAVSGRALTVWDTELRVPVVNRRTPRCTGLLVGADEVVTVGRGRICRHAFDDPAPPTLIPFEGVVTSAHAAGGRMHLGCRDGSIWRCDLETTEVEQLVSGLDTPISLTETMGGLLAVTKSMVVLINQHDLTMIPMHVDAAAAGPGDRIAVAQGSRVLTGALDAVTSALQEPAQRRATSGVDWPSDLTDHRVRNARLRCSATLRVLGADDQLLNGEHPVELPLEAAHADLGPLLRDFEILWDAPATISHQDRNSSTLRIERVIVTAADLFDAAAMTLKTRVSDPSAPDLTALERTVLAEPARFAGVAKRSLQHRPPAPTQSRSAPFRWNLANCEFQLRLIGREVPLPTPGAPEIDLGEVTLAVPDAARTAYVLLSRGDWITLPTLRETYANDHVAWLTTAWWLADAITSGAVVQRETASGTSPPNGSTSWSRVDDHPLIEWGLTGEHFLASSEFSDPLEAERLVGEAIARVVADLPAEPARAVRMVMPPGVADLVPASALAAGSAPTGGDRILDKVLYRWPELAQLANGLAARFRGRPVLSLRACGPHPGEPTSAGRGTLIIPIDGPITIAARPDRAAFERGADPRLLSRLPPVNLLVQVGHGGWVPKAQGPYTLIAHDNRGVCLAIEIAAPTSEEFLRFVASRLRARGDIAPWPVSWPTIEERSCARAGENAAQFERWWRAMVLPIEAPDTDVNDRVGQSSIVAPCGAQRLANGDLVAAGRRFVDGTQRRVLPVRPDDRQ